MKKKSTDKQEEINRRKGRQEERNRGKVCKEERIRRKEERKR